MPKIEVETTEARVGSRYAPPHNLPCKDVSYRKLSDGAGLTQFGVNLKRIPPGQWSSQRHWHLLEDEFVWILAGEVVLVTDEGEQVLRAGDCAGFPAGVANGHHLQNRSTTEATVLEMGSRHADETCVYPDVGGLPY